MNDDFTQRVDHQLRFPYLVYTHQNQFPQRQPIALLQIKLFGILRGIVTAPFPEYEHQSQNPYLITPIVILIVIVSKIFLTSCSSPFPD
jgi:hypothetical protein